MKNVLAVFLFLPYFSMAQDSCHLKKETDPFTHQTKISTGFVAFPSNGVQLKITIDATNADIDFFLWLTNDSKCFDDQSTIQINYDGDRLKATFRNSGSMNCEGAFHFNFRNTVTTATNLERLTTRKIKSIRLINNKVITDIVFNDDQKQILVKMAACLVKNAKTLIAK